MTASTTDDRLIGQVQATRIVDLSHPLYEGMPVWPGGVPFTMVRVSDYPQGYRYHTFEMAENVGTHVDAPSHFVPGTRSIDQIPLNHLVRPAVVLNIQHRVGADPDYRLSATDVTAWESEYGSITGGSLVLVNTGWSRRFYDPESYMNRGADGLMHFPGIAESVARLLVTRDVVGVGIDTASIDYGPSPDYAAHKVLLAANLYQIENLTNLDALPPVGATVVVGVLKVQDGSEAQARVFGLLP